MLGTFMKNGLGNPLALPSTLLCILALLFFVMPTTISINKVNSQSSIPFNKANIFATSEFVNIVPQNAGKWERTENGSKFSWTYEINVEASSLNFGFSEFVLPPSAIFTICDKKNITCQQFLPREDTQHHLELWTPILKGNFAKLRLIVDAKEKEMVRLRLSSINKGIKRIDRSSISQECLIDVVCLDDFPQIEDWEKEIQSVGLISIEGTKLCSGVLLNNVRQDFTPYFLTARHCGINAQNAASVVVHWNYENSTCRFGQESNKEEGDGSLMQFNSGATFLADLQASDFTLLELNERVVDEAKAYFAGWNAEATAPVDVTTIHHANTEEKRITFGEGETSITRHFGEDEDPDLNHIRISDWSISSTSGGSSGAPLFDAAHRVVGQLHGGLAACDNNESDWFGRFHTSWEGDGIPERQLRHWLDPDDSGLTILNGKWSELEPLSLQVSINKLSEIICAGDSTGSIRIDIANGAGPFRYSIDGGENFQSQRTFQNLGAGFYSILVKDAKENTSAIIPFFIDEPDPIVMTFDQVYNQVELNVEGGEAPFLFTRNGQITFDSVFNNLPVGINLFVVVDSKGCTTKLEVDLKYPVFQSQLEVVQEISCHDSNDGVVSIQHSGTIGPYMYQLNNGPLSTNNIFENLEPGNYVGLVLDSLGNQVGTQILNLEAPEIIDVSLVQVEENIIVNVMGGVPPYTYQYDSGEFTKENQFLISDNVEIVVVKDANECSLETINMITSTAEELDIAAMIVYPNPVTNILRVDLNQQKIDAYRIVNSIGSVLHSAEQANSNAEHLEIEVENLASGVYFLQVYLDDSISKLMKFIVL